MCEQIMLLRYVGSQKLSEMLQQPYDLYKAGWADAYLMGLINQVIIIISSSNTIIIVIIIIIIIIIITSIIVIITSIFVIIMDGCLPHGTDQPGLTLSS